MWLTEEMSRPEIKYWGGGTSAFRLKSKKREGSSICAGQSLVYPTFSAAYGEVTD